MQDVTMKQVRIAALATMLIAVACGPAFGQSTAPSGHGTAMAKTGSDASTAYMDAMASMNRKMDGMRMTGDVDIDFVQMMIPHHQSAVDMAEAYLQQGTDPQLRTMSQQIVTSQREEIGILQAWLAKHRKP
jgi:uncharacterized protein (DUF305 family)